MEGSISLPRNIAERSWSNSPITVYVFVRLVLKANWKEASWFGETVGRGELITSISSLSKELGIKDSQTRYALKCLREDKRITCVGTNQFTKITICEYESYQFSRKTDSQTDSQTEVQAEVQTNNERSDNNRIKEIKEEKEKVSSTDYSEQVLALYKLYPAKCPLRGASTQKCDKCKKKIAGLLKQMPYEELKKIFVRYIDENYNKHYLLNFQTFLNNLPDYGEADSELFSSPQVAPAPSSNGAQRFKSREEAVHWATHPTDEEIKLRYERAFLPIHPMLEGETQEQFRERIRPEWKKFLDEWVGRRLQEVNNNY